MVTAKVMQQIIKKLVLIMQVTAKVIQQIHQQILKNGGTNNAGNGKGNAANPSKKN